MRQTLGLAIGVAVLAASTLTPTGGDGWVDGAQAATKRGVPPCQAAFPNARRKTIGKTTWFNRQESVRAVLCHRFGLDPSADFPVSSSMVCGFLAQIIGKGSRRLGVFVDGACSGADLADDPRTPAKYIGAACSWASDLLGALAKPAGVLGSLGCTLAPPTGHSLGAMFESKHEFDVAVDVIRRDRCIKYSPTHFGSPWLADECAPADKGFDALPPYRPPNQVAPQLPGAPAPFGPPGPTFPSGPGTLILNPPSIVNGQSVRMEPTGQCPPGTTTVGVELVVPGASFDPNGPVNFYHGLDSWPRLSYEGTRWSPVAPGNYDLLAACLTSSAAVASPLHLYRAPLKVTGPPRTVSITPTTVPEGGTITITPDAPCAGLNGGEVAAFVVREGTTYSSQQLGTVDSSCNWGPSTLTLDPDVLPGPHRVDVFVGKIIEGPAFWYASAQITVE